ncbi:Gmad2 immunoglobulin-like domain-containing protein [Melghirimyces algeriensis]|uniref:Immunoglobulin-like domain of spore germination n=1 Tax=Melghirimyces algeriensis TaxID=910412 RepID=A0A521E2M9_9BACL|nr:Gmad2 immunoglobulin-like domain-containing protein [Melghirimyces algeriensis]SMO78209.1 Immunoglobulin-like domain of spore germination [Melghirimyces algeriensis]
MKPWISWMSVFILVTALFPAGSNAFAAEEDDAFRHVKRSDPWVEYVVEGEARVFEGTYHYRVKDEEKILAEGWGTASEGGPEWGSFKQTIQIPTCKAALKETLQLELFERSAKDGSEVHRLTIPLRAGDVAEKNDAFRKIQIQEPQVKYPVGGEARVFEANYHYVVSDGHYELVEGHGTASTGAPDWGVFQETIVVPLKRVPINGALVLELYELDGKNGQRSRFHYVLLDQTPWPECK